jgi:hypothetical protein
MRVLWTLVKVALVLALVIPVSIFVLATTLGLLGALVGIAFAVLRLAVIGLVAYGAFRLFGALFRKSKPAGAPSEIRALPPIDPYYEAAKRELDIELGERPSRA